VFNTSFRQFQLSVLSAKWSTQNAGIFGFSMSVWWQSTSCMMLLLIDGKAN